MRIAPRLLTVAFVVLFAAALAGCDPGTPEASFTAAPSEGRAPLTVQFTDTSENSPESWAWDFGDGASSTEQSPIHTYNSAGTYDVALVASNDDGSSTAEVSRAITVGPGELTAVRLSDNALAIQVGGAHAVSVLAVDAFGNEITGADVSWSLAAGGSVDATGTVTAGTVAGYFDDALTVTVVGGSMTLTASASLTVLPGPLASADFSLTEFAVGETRQLSATAHDRHGNVIDDAEVQWTAASGGAIDDEGVFTAGPDAGTFSDAVVATVAQGGETLAVAHDVTVLPGPLASVAIDPAEPTVVAGGKTALSFIATDAYGNPLAPANVRWDADPRAGAIGLDGSFTATTKAGAYETAVRVVATMDGVTQTGDADITVTRGPLSILAISTDEASVEVGGMAAFTATAADAFGNPFSTDATGWSTIDGHQIDQAGLFAAGTTAGVATVRARLNVGGSSATAMTTVEVLPGPLARVALQPEASAVKAGETLQFTAVAMDEHGNTLDGLPIAWRSLSAGGSVDGNGALTAGVRAGEYGATVEATAAQDSASFTAVAPVTVVPGPLSQVVIGPASVSLGTGMSQQYVVVAGDRFGNPIDEFEPVWTATAGAISEDGLFTAPDTPDDYEDAVTVSVTSVGVTATASGDVTVEPDRVAFISTRNEDEAADIYLMAADGSDVRRVTFDFNAYSPKWSPDGRRLVFEIPGSGIYATSDDGEGTTAIVRSSFAISGVGTPVEPAWSPDGNSIAFVSRSFAFGPASFSSVSRDIYVADVNGERVTQLTNTPGAAEYAPSWSPDGKMIVYDRTVPATRGDIWIMNADGSGQRELFATDENESYPSFSPDGSKIVFSSSRDGDSEIYVMDVTGEGLRKLTGNTYADWAPHWSADGSQIVFSSDRSGNDEVFVMSADGTDEAALTDDDATDRSPAWSPRKRGVSITAASLALRADPSPAVRPANEVVAEARASIVGIKRGDGTGSGFIIDPSGLVLTDNHVIEGSNELTVLLDDGTELSAYVIGRDLIRDLAVLGIRSEDGTLFPAISLTSRPIGLADQVVALGLPLGSDVITATSGLVSALRTDEGTNTTLVQTEAAVNPGNSGGPLVNLQGEVVGIIVSKLVHVVIEGVGFAVSTATINTYLDRLIAGEAIGAAVANKDPDVSPDGSKVAFASDRTGDWEIYVVETDGTGLTRVTFDRGNDARPVWSPDGSKIAFESDRDDNWEIYVANADGTNPTRLTDDPGADRNPVWSPDGSQIAFDSDRDDNTDVYTVNAEDGSELTRITMHDAVDDHPTWSPDGTRIAFRSWRDDDSEIYAVNLDMTDLDMTDLDMTDLDMTDLARLTSSLGSDRRPSWSPDGARILFSSTRDDNEEIYVMNADGSEATRLTENTVADHSPRWSADGSRVVFVSRRDGYDQVYEMNPDGSAPRRIT